MGTFGVLLLLNLWDGLIGYLPTTASGSLLGLFIVLLIVCFLLQSLSNNWKITAVVLVVGGIQGDEPGGFSAAALCFGRRTSRNPFRSTGSSSAGVCFARIIIPQSNRDCNIFSEDHRFAQLPKRCGFFFTR